MSVQIGPGPANLVAHDDIKSFLAGEAIAAGQLVSLDGSASGEARGYTVVLANSGAAATTYVVGIAKAAIASGSWGQVYVGGYVPVVKTDNGVAAGDFLVAHTVDGECDTMADGEEEQVFGMALETDTGDEAACLLFRRI